MRINEKFVLRTILGKSILMPIMKNELTNDPLSLNSVAEQIFLCLDQVSDRECLISKMRDLYGLEKNSSEEKDVRDFIGQLLEMNLIIE